MVYGQEGQPAQAGDHIEDDDLTPLDHFKISLRPLGARMCMDTKQAVSASERAAILDARQERKHSAFKKFLDWLEQIQWHLCDNCW
jgi:hypothetical protein